MVTDIFTEFALNTEDPEINFRLALHYHGLGHTASAFTHYFRCAERTENNSLKYECFIRSYICYASQGKRDYTALFLLKQAIAISPTRPEAYYLLSKHYEHKQDWNECFFISKLAISICKYDHPNLRIRTEYLGEYCILFQYALSCWWLDKTEESYHTFIHILKNFTIPEHYEKIIINNLNNHFKTFNNSENHDLFTKDKHSRLKNKFSKYSEIETNHSQAYQDIFVLTVLNGKTNGTYLEIGAGSCFYGNNTALLEQQFDWRGISLDIAEYSLNEFKNGSRFYPGKKRKNQCILKDARTIDYEKFLKELELPNNIDYLQIDCDPPNISYEILLTIPFEKYKFAVITFEHDKYKGDGDYQNKARKYLESYGYVCVVNNVAPDEWRAFEDWFVHPDLVDKKHYQNLIQVDNSIKKAEQIFLSNE
jgi:hypothetical protein